MHRTAFEYVGGEAADRVNVPRGRGALIQRYAAVELDVPHLNISVFVSGNEQISVFQVGEAANLVLVVVFEHVYAAHVLRVPHPDCVVQRGADQSRGFFYLLFG